MSTYIQGVTDTGFNPISYTPNFPYMINALQKAQAKYDANYNEIASSYDKVANSLLLNPENNQYRSQFLENTKEQLKQLSSKDLSLRENVDEAEKLFTPFWEDEDLLADYKISKQYQSQVAEYNRLKNSDKKDDRDRAWDKGLQFVQLTAQNMSLAKRGDGSIQKIKVNEYVPNIDVHAEVNKYINESGYKDGITSIKNENGHLVLVTNGPGSKETYSAVVDNYIKNRPDLQKIFMVEGTVDFQNMVNYQMENNPNINRQEAEKLAKQNYITTKTSDFKSKISNYNNILKGTLNDDGLESKYTKLLTEISDSYDKGIDPSIEKLNEFREYQTQISSIKQQVNKYESVLKSLQSDDFNRPDVNLNSYFSEQYRHIFSEDIASTRAAATSEKLITDSEAIAAMKLLVHQQDQDRKYGAVQETVRTDNKGNIVVTKKGYNEDGSLNVAPEEITFQSDENMQAGIKESASKISEKKSDVPIVVDNKTTQEDLETSFFTNFNKNISKNRDMFISGVAQYINTDSKLATDFPSIYKYVDYLSSLINRTTSTNKNIGSVENLKKTFDALKNNENTKNYFKDFESYNSSPVLQLRSLLDYVDASSTNPSLDRASLRPLIDDSASRFSISFKILEDFKTQYAKDKVSPEFTTVVRKNKDGSYRIINADDVIKLAGTVFKYEDKGLPWYEQLKNLPHAMLQSLVPQRKLDYGKALYAGKLPQEIAQAYVDGRLDVKKVYRKERIDDVDGGFVTINNQRYEYTDQNGKVWDLTDLTKNLNGLLPQDLKEKINNRNKNTALKFNDFLETKYPQYDRSFVLNKTLQYTNDASTPKFEISRLIAQDGIDDNKGNIIQKTPGIILPNNYSQLIKNSNEDDVNKLLEILLKNPSELDKVLAKTELSYSGQTSDKSLVKLIFDSENLNKLIKNTFSLKANSSEERSLFTAVQSLITNGIELNINNNIFLKYAKDDYMSSIVTDQMLSTGIKASDYEKNKLYYDYNLVLGSEGQIIVRPKVKKYDPTLNTFEWKEYEPQSYPKEVGIDNILRSLREAFMPNAQAIYSYLKQQSEIKSTKLKNNKKKEGETPENHINRILKQD